MKVRVKGTGEGQGLLAGLGVTCRVRGYLQGQGFLAGLGFELGLISGFKLR